MWLVPQVDDVDCIEQVKTSGGWVCDVPLLYLLLSTHDLEKSRKTLTKSPVTPGLMLFNVICVFQQFC